jgi:hypothetical protein
VATLVALGVAAGACKAGPPGGQPAPSASSPPPEPVAPATPEVTALLDGLEPGDRLEGFAVSSVGAVRSDGVVPIELEAPGKRISIVVALATASPPAPAGTEKYGVYYERADRSGATNDEAQRVAAAIAQRVRKTEQRVAVPPGMKKLARAGQPT